MSLAELIEKRRQAHHEQDHSQAYPEHQQHQHRTAGAQHAHAESQNLDERKQHQKLEAEYRANNLGAGQATVEQMEKWKQEQQAKQAPEQRLDGMAERDWEVAAHRAQNRDRTNPDNTNVMPMEKAKLPDLNDPAVLSQAPGQAKQQDEAQRRGIRR